MADARVLALDLGHVVGAGAGLRRPRGRAARRAGPAADPAGHHRRGQGRARPGRGGRRRRRVPRRAGRPGGAGRRRARGHLLRLALGDRPRRRRPPPDGRAHLGRHPGRAAGGRAAVPGRHGPAARRHRHPAAHAVLDREAALAGQGALPRPGPLPGAGRVRDRGAARRPERLGVDGLGDRAARPGHRDLGRPGAGAGRGGRAGPAGPGRPGLDGPARARRGRGAGRPWPRRPGTR